MTVPVTLENAVEVLMSQPYWQLCRLPRTHREVVSNAFEADVMRDAEWKEGSGRTLAQAALRALHAAGITETEELDHDNP